MCLSTDVIFLWRLFYQIFRRVVHIMNYKKQHQVKAIYIKRSITTMSKSCVFSVWPFCTSKIIKQMQILTLSSALKIWSLLEWIHQYKRNNQYSLFSFHYFIKIFICFSFCSIWKRESSNNLKVAQPFEVYMQLLFA